MKAIRTDEDVQRELLKRRQFLTTAGGAGVAAAAAFLLPGKANAVAPAQLDNTSGDTAEQILTAALIAEDLATVFYYNGLRGMVIEDPSLAGPGGTANKISSTGNAGNVSYLKAALIEEGTHATLFRNLLNSNVPSSDPYQTFYFPTGTFDTLGAFTSMLNALEDAFIGAYLAATLEFAQMATDSRANGVRQPRATGGYYGAHELQWFSQVCASILGVEAEHRVLGRDLSNTVPPNQYVYEQTDGIATVFNGSASAVAALTPFLAAGSGLTAYSLHDAVSGSQSYKIAISGTALPPQPPARGDGQ
ncbi:ferritin-like domain-containing protein [Acidicapsa ligni]|uniref:ferritin-like domain-containing protein n=1 Tax=Acidicapsa ligni TaxID=542300 RepID=UPI0021DFE975|nr:ferritin-like domain-containing protein [Acidicapsa ligni]